MSRVRINYQVLDVLVGPAPSSGYYFIDYSGNLNNNYNNLIDNHNLIKKIDRVQNFNYSFNAPRTDIAQLGKKSLVARPIINSPTVDFTFDYVLMGLKNEARLGLNVNYGKFEYPYRGEPYYNDNNVFLFSGILSRDLRRDMTAPPFWPFDYRDRRNFHLIIAPEGQDANDNKQPNENQSINPRSQQYHVLSFGNCYLNTYRVSASVGGLPTATVGYIGENVRFDLNGSGIQTPAVKAIDRSNFTGINFVIPDTSSEGGPSALLPLDILLSITDSTGNDFGANITDAKINSFSFEINLNREPLPALGYKLPLDREINLPILCDLNVNMIIGDFESGALNNLLQTDKDYNINIKWANPECYTGEFVTEYYAASTFTPTQYLYTNSTSKLQGSGWQNFTLMGWAYLGIENTDQAIVGKWSSSNANKEYLLFYDNAKDTISFNVGDGVGFTGVDYTGTISANTWYLVFGFHDKVNNQIGIQVNNYDAIVKTYISGVTNGTQQFVVGASNNGAQDKFSGKIDEVAFWNRVLTTGERNYLYNNGYGNPYYRFGENGNSGQNLNNGLVSYWTLNQTGRRFDYIDGHHLDPVGNPGTGAGVIPNNLSNTAIMYDFKKIKFNGISYSSAIGQNKTASLSFTAELDPDDLSKGLFISGLLNLEKIQDFLISSHTGGTASGDRGYVLDADGGRIVLNKIPIY